MDYTMEIQKMYPEGVIQVIMIERNGEERIIEQPIIQKENHNIMDTHLYLDKEIFQIRKKEKPVMCKKCLQLTHPVKY